MSEAPNQAASDRPQNSSAWWREWEPYALVLLVVGCYFTRLTAAPVCGEESRWATAAREMIASGDWIVPRQQGAVFPERPPMSSWAMAVVGLVRSEVDLLAVRLPSAIAVLLMTLLIYCYARTWLSRLGALAAAVCFASFGQTLPLGRFGESEAVFTLWTGGALLCWHWGYVRGWSREATWSLAYSLAACGALTKGPQAPLYLLAATTLYLIARRDWQWLCCRGHALGLACFAVIVGLWLVPFARGHWDVTDDVWAGLAQDRFTTRGLAKHLWTYPAETFGCLLPWSPLLLVLVRPSVRAWLARERRPVAFLLVALAASYPSVWLAAGARGRYFMPLYPCLAVLLGLMIEHCTSAGASWGSRWSWRIFLRGAGAAMICGAIVVLAASMATIPALAAIRQSATFLVPWLLAAAAGAAVLVWASLHNPARRAPVALLALAGFVGVTYTGVMLSARVHDGNDLQPVLAQLKGRLPEGARLVSLGPVYHRFSFAYGKPIKSVEWPDDTHDIPSDTVWFCFDKRPTDTAELRADSDGRDGRVSKGTLPFAWEQVAEIPCDPFRRDQPERLVVIGRIRRDLLAEQSDINRPVRR